MDVTAYNITIICRYLIFETFCYRQAYPFFHFFYIVHLPVSCVWLCGFFFFAFLFIYFWIFFFQFFICILTPRLDRKYRKRQRHVSKKGKCGLQSWIAWCQCRVCVLVCVCVSGCLYVCLFVCALHVWIVWKIFSSVAALLSKERRAHMKMHGERLAHLNFSTTLPMFQCEMYVFC